MDNLQPAVVVGVKVEVVKGLEERVQELSTAHSLLTLHPLSHTAWRPTHSNSYTVCVTSDLSLANMLATLKGLAMSDTNSTAPTSLHQLQLSFTLHTQHSENTLSFSLSLT